MASRCKVEGCPQNVASNGYCGKHWVRVKKHGDPNKVLRVRGETPVALVCAACSKPFVRSAAEHRKRIKAGITDFYCSTECHNQDQATTDISAAFWEKVDKRGSDECWEWKAGGDEDGYGIFSLASIGSIRAHRFAFKDANGIIDPDLMVLHSCDNPPCCNPKHLWQGTDKDNQADMAAKGRHGDRPAAPGERNAKAKITAADVVEIRRRSDQGESGPSIGRDYGLSGASVRLIARRKTWKHVSEEIGE